MFDRSLTSKEQTKLSSEIALSDAIIMRALEALRSGEIWSKWDKKEFSSAWHLVTEGLARRDSKRVDSGAQRLDALDKQLSDRSGWSEELHRWVDQRRKLVLAESKRLQLEDRYISIERVNLLLAAVLTMIFREVSDYQELSRIIEEFKRITGGRIAKAVEDEEESHRSPTALLPPPKNDYAGKHRK